MLGYEKRDRQLSSGRVLTYVVDSTGYAVSSTSNSINCDKLIELLELYNIRSIADWKKLPWKIRKAYIISFLDLHPRFRS